VQRNRNAQLRLRALQEIAAARDAEAFDTAIDIMAVWPRDERREGVKIMLQALAEKRIGRRDQANAWIWRMAEYTREVHEEYAVQRWPETKRLLGLLVNSSGGAHARNARRLVHAARRQDRRLSAALLAAALAHTPEAEEALRGARTRMARKPSALARELLRNFPRGRRGRGSRRRRKGVNEVAAEVAPAAVGADGAVDAELELDDELDEETSGSDDGPSAEVVEEAYDEALEADEPVADAPPLPNDERSEVEDAVAEALEHDAETDVVASSRRRRGSGRRRAAATPAADVNGSAPDPQAALELVPTVDGSRDTVPASRRRAPRRRRVAAAESRDDL
jgi:ribonuclease E